MLKLSIRVLIVFTTVGIMLGALEFYFRNMHLQSDAYNFTLMAKRWLAECWNPTWTVPMPQEQLDAGVPPFVVRDREWTDSDVAGKVRVMVIGDSFVAGHGICNAEDRFSNRIGAGLGDEYAVFNVAMNGWGTPEETFYPRFYPYAPDVVVLSYYVNDIRNAITTSGHDFPSLPTEAEWMKQPLWKDSYLLDYVYWQVIYRRQFADSSAELGKALANAYQTPDIWAEHEAELRTIINWTRDINAALIVVTFPTLENVEGARPQLEKVEKVFRENGVTVISGLDLFAGIPPAELVVSNIDTHPNERAHRIVADALLEVVRNIAPPNPPKVLNRKS
jgi:hypothetical protein